MIKFLTILFILVYFLGCGSPAVTHKVIYKDNQVDPVIMRKTMVMDEKKKKELIEQAEKVYRINVGDKLIISVFEHPELSTSASPSEASKTMVNLNGNIQLPRLGLIHAAGKTVEELRTIITNRLKKYLLHPDVTVTTAYVKKSRYYLLGEFTETGSFEKDYPLTLMELLALGKGIKYKTSDLRHAYVVRNNKKLPINLYRLLKKGDISQNIDMRDRDTIMIPSSADQVVYMFGRVADVGLTKIPLVDGKLTLMQALTLSRFSDAQEVHANLKTIYIVRTEMDRIETFVVNAEEMFRGDTVPFELVAGDVIYIPKSKLGTINTVISKIFPTLQLIHDSLTDIQTYRDVILREN